MSEKTVTRLRRRANAATEAMGGQLAKAGHREVRRRWYATPWNERRRFDVLKALKGMQLRDIKRRILLQHAIDQRAQARVVEEKQVRSRAGFLGWRSAVAGVMALAGINERRPHFRRGVR